MLPFASMVVGDVRRLISTPMKANGAQEARAQGLTDVVSQCLIWYVKLDPDIEES